jgi:hypothetical protein
VGERADSNRNQRAYIPDLGEIQETGSGDGDGDHDEEDDEAERNPFEDLAVDRRTDRVRS